MTPRDFLTCILDPGLTLLRAALPAGDRPGLPDDRVRLLLLAIAGQETEWSYRLQLGGPARSYWQFEQGGGIRGVLTHPASQARILAVCAALDVPPIEARVFDVVAWCDPLAVAFARLLVWTDPAPLPDVGQPDAAWAVYARQWRPGRPRPEAWPVRYAAALQALSDAGQAPAG